nr:hypothetical protein [Tanacetum cinerariifolium]
MANLPPPNHALDFPEDEPVHPKPASIIPDHAPVQPDGYLRDVEIDDGKEDSDEEPEEQLEPEPEPNHMNGFALHPLPQQENIMNEIDDDEMEVNDNDEDDAEVIHPYEETYEITYNLPNKYNNNKMKSSKARPKLKMFSEFFWEGSSARAHLVDNSRVSAPGPMGCNIKTLHSKSDKRMNDFDYDLSALEATVREQGLDHSEMVWLVEGLNDPYVIVRDAATSAARDDGDDATSPEDP